MPVVQYSTIRPYLVPAADIQTLADIVRPIPVPVKHPKTLPVAVIIHRANHAHQHTILVPDAIPDTNSTVRIVKKSLFHAMTVNIYGVILVMMDAIATAIHLPLIPMPNVLQ